MTDYSDPTSSHRLSNAERDAAVASLARSLADGRITTEEFTERSSAAKAAITRADLAPLFADLPAETGPSGHTPPAAGYAAAPPAAGYAAAPPAAGYAAAPPASSYPASGYAPQGPAGYSAPPPSGSVGPYDQYGSQPGDTTVFAVLRAIVPILGLILFFTFGYFNILGGWSTSWIWFVLVGVFFAVTAALTGQRRR